MDEVVIEPKGSHEPEGVRTPKKAAIAAWIGSVLEYYDFFIYGTAAALVFPSIFFPQGNQTVATIASLATFGVGYVGYVVDNASASNGVFALVLGLLAFLYLAAVVGVLCVEINVVRVDRLYPRALLTPFTDDVDLTPGDRRSYTGSAKAQRAKGFQEVDVRFDKPPREPAD